MTLPYILFNVIVILFDVRLDEESRQREERVSSLPVLQPKPMPRLSPASEGPSNIQKPPIKPRRSIKCRPIAQPGSGQSDSQANQMENEVTATTQSLLTMNSSAEIFTALL